MKKILFLSSGGGGTLRFIDKAKETLELPCEIIGSIADRDCGATRYCFEKGYDCYVFDSWKNQTPQIVNKIQTLKPDIVITNIYKILAPEIFSCCNAVFINLHYSLLPSFGGVIGFKTLELAKNQNSKIIGATCHEVNDQVDAGRILSQGAMSVDWNEDMDKIGNEIFRISCKTILTAILAICGVNAEMQSTDGYMYSPTINFDDRYLDEDFWNTVKNG